MTVAVVGLGIAQPDWCSMKTLERPERPEAELALSTEGPQPPEIELQRQIVVARLRLKDTIVDDVCLGRLTLLEAAARFRDLDQMLPVRCTDEFFRLRYQPSSDEECYCLKVIVAAESQLRALGRPPSLISARLRAELHDKRKAGTLRFPEATPIQN
jgi:hypothetical protein